MILITGATGTNGREIIEQLSAKGVKARAMVRKREDVRLPRTLNVEFIKGDFDDASSLDAALAGVEQSFLLSPSSAEQVTREANFIRAAKRAGVRHVVKFSILGAAPNSPSRLIRRHGEAEKMLEDSGIVFTMLRPHYFMQNLLWYILTLIKSKKADNGVRSRIWRPTLRRGRGRPARKTASGGERPWYPSGRGDRRRAPRGGS